MLVERFLGKLGQFILRTLERLAPAAFGLEFFKKEGGKVVLLAFGQLGGLLERFFQKSSHDDKQIRSYEFAFWTLSPARQFLKTSRCDITI